MKIEEASKNQRRCCLYPNTDCISCEIETCPYIYCQHIDCMACTQRMMCPMCEGACTECSYYTICTICIKAKS